MSEMVRSGLVNFHPDLEPLLTDIDSVRQHVDNPNNGDVEAITESIEVNGMYRPIQVQRSTGFILAGNHTWEACKTLGATLIPVVWLDVDEATALRMVLADNRTAALARPDNAQLLRVLQKVNDTDSLMGTGYAERDIETLQHLSRIKPHWNEHEQWPTICTSVPPATREAYLAMTEVAVGDRERLELLMRMAGWDGRNPD